MPGSDSKTAISVSGVTKKFGNFTAVDNLSFAVKRGELFGLLGPNGAGKSTTIKMLTTLLKPSNGSLLLDGHDVTKDQTAARKRFGIVFQDPSVDNEMSAYENMQLHAALYGQKPSEAKTRIQSLMQLVDLWDRRDTLVKNYSGGMKRRLEIARGLLHHPAILFLDEPTLGLDTQTRNLLWNYVRQLSRDEGTTIFFTTHYLEEAEAVADRIAIIDHGALAAIGTTKELTKQTGTKTLEAAYLSITGESVRDENTDKHEAWRARHRAMNMR